MAAKHPELRVTRFVLADNPSAVTAARNGPSVQALNLQRSDVLTVLLRIDTWQVKPALWFASELFGVGAVFDEAGDVVTLGFKELETPSSMT